MPNRRPVCGWVLPKNLLLVLLLLFCQPVQADLRSNAASWLEVFGPVPASTPMLSRVNGIFERIKRVAGSAVLRSELVVVNSDNKPWAIALEDDNIILSRGALDVIYSGSDDSLAAKDARMAFVLGHELAHIVANDFWHQHVYNNFLNNDSLLALQGQKQETLRELERRADEQGFISASLAGYNMREVFSATGGDKDFLQHWARQTNTISGGSHHTPAERMRLLKSRLRNLDNTVEYFKYGVRLAHFGRYEDARILLDEFYKNYSSRQVLSNLGYVYVQLARQKMPVDLAYRFWFPTLLEIDSGLPERTRNLASRLPADAEQDLRTAVELLKAGAAMDSADLTVRINLIAAYMYLGEYYAARNIIEQALDGRDGNQQLLGLKAIVVMQEKEFGDPWDTNIRKRLEQMASSDTGDDNIIYNYARLLEDRKRSQAVLYWIRLADRLETLPANYQEVVCRQLMQHGKISRNASCKRRMQGYGVTSMRWNPALEPGEDVDDPASRKILASWGEPIGRNIDRLNAKIFRHPNGDSLLAIDHKVELVTLKQHGIQYKQELRTLEGAPLVDAPIGTSRVWSYGPSWSALVRGEQVDEIWIAR